AGVFLLRSKGRGRYAQRGRLLLEGCRRSAWLRSACGCRFEPGGPRRGRSRGRWGFSAVLWWLGAVDRLPGRPFPVQLIVLPATVACRYGSSAANLHATKARMPHRGITSDLDAGRNNGNALALRVKARARGQHPVPASVDRERT